MKAVIWIERCFDKKTGRTFRAVILNGWQTAAFWHLSEALHYAEWLAEHNNAQLRSGEVMPFIGHPPSVQVH